MKMLLRATIMLLLIFQGIQAFAGPDELLGIWYNEPKTGKIEIYKSADKYYGKIIWLKEPLDDKGKEKTDNKNPDESKHNVKIMGLLVLWDFHYNADDKNYQDGKIYDPKEGKTYKCKMKLIDHNNLDVRGYIGFSLIGRTEHWVRTSK